MDGVVRLFLIGTVVVTLQWLFFGRLDLWGAIPDVVLLFVIWVAVRYGRTTGTVVGFLVGFALDAIYGLWGIHMFVKTLIGFLIGHLNMINSEVFVRSIRRVIETTLVVSLVHNSLIMFFVVTQQGMGWGNFFWVLCVGSTLYTTFIAFLAASFRPQ